MSTANTDHEYRVPAGKRARSAATSFIPILVATFIGNTLAALLGSRGGIPVFTVICFSVAIFFFLDKRAKVLPYGLWLKPSPFNKAVEYRFSDGAFSLEEWTGFKAFFMCWSLRTPVICFTQKASGRKLGLIFLLTEQDARELFDKLQAASEMAAQTSPSTNGV